MAHHKYTDQERKCIRDNFKLGYEELAKTIGVKANALKKQVWVWRCEDASFPRIRGVADNTRTIRMIHGKEREYVKIGNAWKIVPLTKQQRLPVITKIKKPSNMKKGRAPKTAPHREKARLATKKVDLSDKIAVSIPELKLTVYVSAGKDVNKVRQRYLDHYEFINKRKAI
jgi:hypothetical protein